MHSISEHWGAHGFDPNMANLRYFGDRNEAAPYLSYRGWDLTTSSAHDLFSANGLPPFDGDTDRMGELLYVNGALGTNAK